MRLTSVCAMLVLLLVSTNSALARPMHVLASALTGQLITRNRGSKSCATTKWSNAWTRAWTVRSMSCSHRPPHPSQATTCFIGS
jgi:hypothetical protein